MGLVALVPAAVKLLCYPHYIGSDDACIHLRIATNFVGGLGWGIKSPPPGESIHEPRVYVASRGC
jgi:hypothetical protein